MSEENISQEFRLKNIIETRNYLIEEINQDELMSRKHKKVYRVLNYVGHLLILISTVTECVYISTFASLVGIPIGIMSSAIELNICVITAGIKKCNSVIKKKKRNHDKIVLLAKSTLNNIEVLITKALIDSNISHNKSVFINNVRKEFYNMKEEIKNSKVKKV